MVRLLELFDQPYSYHWLPGADDSHIAQINTESGTINVKFKHYLNLNILSINFKKNDSYELTDDRDSIKIFSTVVQSIKEFISKNPDKSQNIQFTIGKYEKSRLKLYSALLRKFAAMNGYQFSVSSNDEFSLTFDIVKNQS